MAFTNKMLRFVPSALPCCPRGLWPARPDPEVSFWCSAHLSTLVLPRGAPSTSSSSSLGAADAPHIGCRTPGPQTGARLGSLPWVGDSP